MRAMTALRRNVLFGLMSLLLSAQLTGAHLHLCFDGQEPPVQLHVLETDEGHHASGLSQPHTDEDVALNDTSTRDKPVQFDLPPAAVGAFVHYTAPITTLVAGVRRNDPVPVTARDELLPPMRGPPATSYL